METPGNAHKHLLDVLELLNTATAENRQLMATVTSLRSAMVDKTQELGAGTTGDWDPLTFKINRYAEREARASDLERKLMEILQQ